MGTANFNRGKNMKEFTYADLNKPQERPKPTMGLVIFLTVMFCIWISCWFGLGMAVQAIVTAKQEAAHEQ